MSVKRFDCSGSSGGGFGLRDMMLSKMVEHRGWRKVSG
jgi:hypothetical protein